MRARWFLVMAALALSALSVQPAAALREFEVWRSPFGQFSGLAVNPADGSVWASLGDAVYHYSAGHSLLSKTEGWVPCWLGVDPTDSSCWVVDYVRFVPTAQAVLLHLAADGTVVQRVEGFVGPMVASLTAPDGSIWVAHRGSAAQEGVSRVSAAGQVLARASGWSASDIAVNPGDGTCWALDMLHEQLVHLNLDGSVLWRGGSFAYPGMGRWQDRLAPDPVDGSVWVVDGPNDDLVHVSEAGAEVSRTHFAGGLRCVILNPPDRTCWVGGVPEGLAHVGLDGTVLGYVAGPVGQMGVDPNTGDFWGAAAEDQIGHFAADGTLLWQTGEALGGVCLDEGGGSLWTWSTTTGELVRLTTKAVEVWRGVPYDSPFQPTASGLNTADGSLYFLSGQQATLLRLTREGARQWTTLVYAPPLTTIGDARALAVDPADGSFWADVGQGTDAHGRLYPLYCHFSVEGSQLTSVAGALVRKAVVNPLDGSVWTAQGSRAAHFAEDGTELWGLDLPGVSGGVSVYLQDGSCWFAGEIRHFGQDGTLLADVPSGAFDVSVDQHTGCCWAGQDSSISAYGPAGALLGSFDGFSVADQIAVDSRDGSVWVESVNHDQIVHLWAPTTPFSDVLPGNWAGRAVRMCYEYGIVGGYPGGYYRPEWPVSRAQMAGFVARALAGGDGNVPPGPGTPHFPDVGTDYWAYKYVEYAYANNIVAGYPGGSYVPELAVDRGQMAAFIARAIVTPTGEEGLASYTPPATPSFPDVPTDFWTYKHIEYIREAGIVGGYPDGRYHPGELCTRDQMAVFIARAFELLPY